jgi:hypothetical protein
MRHHSLRPHTFISPEPRERHHEWLTRFTPRQRHQLIQEDYHARMQVFGVLIGAFAFGLSMLLAVLLFAL